ncbi:MAG: glycosyltransferase [Cellvibrionaceae bacterium]
MKILYGVQATGNGHITRARAIAPYLKKAGCDVQYLFSGRKKEDLFDMEPFGDYWVRPGLTFVTNRGRVQLIETAIHNNIFKLISDCRTLDVSEYDLVITDFEPIVAWAAKKAGKTCIGVGHQYAFHHDIPMVGDTFFAKQVLKKFAPVTIGLGLHWHHFDQPILPPIAEVYGHGTAAAPNKIVPNKILVYLGFESREEVVELLKPFKDYEFYYYTTVTEPLDDGNIHIRPLSREGFQKDLADSSGVICNSGFELISEAILLGKKILAKPLKGQMEQYSNALALEILGLGNVMNQLNHQSIENWLYTSKGKQVIYPDVAKAIVDWILMGQWDDQSSLIESLWQQVNCPSHPDFKEADWYKSEQNPFEKASAS